MALPPPPGARTDEIGLNIGGPVDSTEWHYLDTANAQQGPCTADTMKQLLAAGSIHQATYVWNEAMPAWCEYSQSSLASGGTMPPDALGRVLISELDGWGGERGESYKSELPHSRGPPPALD